MLYYALVFLLIAIIAAVFGFTGISLAAAGIAKLLFFVFLGFVCCNIRQPSDAWSSLGTLSNVRNRVGMGL